MVRGQSTTCLPVLLLMAFGCFILRPFCTMLYVPFAAQVQRYLPGIFLGAGLLDLLHMPNGFPLMMIYSSPHLQYLAECMAQSWAHVYTWPSRPLLYKQEQQELTLETPFVILIVLCCSVYAPGPASKAATSLPFIFCARLFLENAFWPLLSSLWLWQLELLRPLTIKQRCESIPAVYCKYFLLSLFETTFKEAKFSL